MYKRQALHDNPALAHSNPISRFWQKQRIKKQYAKTLKAGGKAKKTAEALSLIHISELYRVMTTKPGEVSA